MIFPLSEERNPFSIVIIVTIIVIITVIKTIDFVPLPNQTIIIGPKAIFGREFRTIIYGSDIRLRFSDHHKRSAMIVPAAVAIKNPVIVS